MQTASSSSLCGQQPGSLLRPVAERLHEGPSLSCLSTQYCDYCHSFLTHSPTHYPFCSQTFIARSCLLDCCSHGAARWLSDSFGQPPCSQQLAVVCSAVAGGGFLVQTASSSSLCGQHPGSQLLGDCARDLIWFTFLPVSSTFTLSSLTHSPIVPFPTSQSSNSISDASRRLATTRNRPKTGLLSPPCPNLCLC